MNFCCEHAVWDIIKIAMNYKVIKASGEKHYGLNYYSTIFVARCLISFSISKYISKKKYIYNNKISIYFSCEDGDSKPRQTYVDLLNLHVP